MEELQKNGNVERPSFPVCQQKSTVHKGKQLWETFRVHLGSFSNTVGENWNNHTEEKKGNFILLAASHPSSQDCWVPRRNSPSRVPLARKEEARRANTFSSLLGQSIKISLWFHPTGPAKLRCIEQGTRKKSRGCY